MPNTSFKIRNEQTGEETPLSVSFTDDEWSCFNAYLDHADDLIATELVQIGVPTSVNMNLNKETGVTWRVELPPWNDVIVLLHKLRPFILDDEYASFKRVTSIIGQRLDHPFFRRVLKRNVASSVARTCRTSVSSLRTASSLTRSKFSLTG